MTDKTAGADMGMTAHEWGYLGGRLARLMGDTIRDALTSDALEAVLTEFRRNLAGEDERRVSGNDSQYS